VKAHYKTRSGRLVFELEGETTKELFCEIAAIEGVFEAEDFVWLLRWRKFAASYARRGWEFVF
jgi:hypothetical protein